MILCLCWLQLLLTTTPRPCFCIMLVAQNVIWCQSLVCHQNNARNPSKPHEQSSCPSVILGKQSPIVWGHKRACLSLSCPEHVFRGCWALVREGSPLLLMITENHPSFQHQWNFFYLWIHPVIFRIHPIIFYLIFKMFVLCPIGSWTIHWPSNYRTYMIHQKILKLVLLV